MSKLTFLGTGNAFSDFRTNYFNNALVVGPEGHQVLIDCGATAVQSLKELNVSPHSVGVVFVTHMHDDHVGGIGQLALERYYTPRPGGTYPAKDKTTIIAPPLVMDALKPYLAATLSLFTAVPNNPSRFPWSEMTHCGLDEMFHFVPVTEASVTPTFKVDFFPVHHARVPAYGLTVSENGTVRFVYTSDSEFNPYLWQHFPHVPIFHDCTFSPYYPGTIHTHFPAMLTIPKEDQARTVLMHYHKVPEGLDLQGYKVATRHGTHIL